MKKYIIGIFVLMLTACSSQTNKTYYQLPDVYQGSVPEQVSETQSAKKPQIWVQPIRLSNMLVNAGIVYQTTDINYTVANQHLWINPLDQQLQQNLISGLTKALPGTVVANQPVEDNLAKLTVTVNYFQGRYDGQVIISGDWIYTENNKVVNQPFSLVLTQTEDGYPALVRTLGQGWEQVVSDIAKAIQAQY
ncbi:membrane integrity-associated transporter subunit PqiC [Proteus terrae]|uniref:membrane integrity-associated transporter subunit PqiC n=1 Tax=Proteus terrae TaxID=1574161 RepID=UPI00288B91DC|nr:membrane integrity-associated transporter subunit PqiC [Proteus terrae]